MFRLQRLLPFLVALIAGAVSVGLMLSYVADKERQLARQKAELMKNFQSPVDVLVAASDLAEGTRLGTEHVKVAQVPAQYKQPYATANPNDVVGMVAVADLAKGEQIQRNKVKRAEDVARRAVTLAGITSEGNRAVTIGSDVLSGVGGFVRPGDRVDILWTFKIPEAPGQRGSGELVTLTLFQHVQVLAVGGEMMGRPAERPAQGQSAPRDYTLTLELSPQQASLLLFAREQGRIQLALRSKEDEGGEVALPPANMNVLMESVFGKVPASPSKSSHVVEVFKGLERNVVSVNE